MGAQTDACRGMRDMKRKTELVHGLVEMVPLKDWHFAVLIASLKSYEREIFDKEISHGIMRRKGTRTFSKNLRAYLRPYFVRLVKRTKDEHRRLARQEKQVRELGKSEAICEHAT